MIVEALSYKNVHTAIIGESGCGKSTFAKSIVQMLPPNTICEGDLIVDRKDLRKISKKELMIFRRTRIGFIYQDSIQKLNPLMTVGDHLYELLKIECKMDNAKTKDKIPNAAQRFDSIQCDFVLTLIQYRAWKGTKRPRTITKSLC